MQINIKQLSPLAKMPTYATDGSGWFDLYSINTLPRLVQEGHPVVFDTGLAFEIPPGYGMFILSRSGHGFNFDTRLANCVGCIDSDYRGEVKVILANLGSGPVMSSATKACQCRSCPATASPKPASCRSRASRSSSSMSLARQPVAKADSAALDADHGREHPPLLPGELQP